MTFSKETIRKMYSLTFIFSLVLAVSAQDYVKSDFQVSDTSPYNYREVRMSVSGTGQMFISWGVAGRGQIQYKTISSEGTLLSVQDTVDSPANNYQVQLVHNGLGNCMVMFEGHKGDNDWSVMAQTFDASGSEFGESQSLDLITTESINGARTSLNSNRQNLFGAFLPGTDSAIVVMLSETGELLPDEVILKPEPGVFFNMNMTGIMTNAGDFILVWVHSDGNIWGQKFENNGSPSGSSFQISNKIGDKISQHPIVCTDTAGRFAVIWNAADINGNDLYSQLYDKDGGKLGSNTLIIEEFAPNNSNNLSVDMDYDGKFIVAWQNSENDSLFIYLQQVDNMGAPVGGKYRATTINNDMPDGISIPAQVSPSVRLMRDTIYLAWANHNSELSNTTTVYANIRKWKIHDTTGPNKPGMVNGDLVLYPNPSNGLLSLKFPTELSEDMTINIYTSQGSLVSQRMIHVTGQEIRISLPELAEGYYYLEVRAETFQASESIIIH
jgi:hypothetical protein